MSAYNFPTTTEVTTLESTTLDTSTVNNYNFVNNEKPVPAVKFRGILKALKDIIAWLKADDEAWITPTLLNSWTDWAAAFDTPAYYKDKSNVVHLKGLARNGTATSGTVLFNLPSGYRPAKEKIFVTVSNDAFGQIRIQTDGDVVIQTGSTAWISFEGITFRV